MTDYSRKDKQKKIKCEVCSEVKAGYIIHWKVSWFRGDDEVERICGNCLAIREREDAEREEAYIKKMTPIWEAKAKRDAEFWDSMKQRLEAKYEVKYLTEYHWRINNVMDIYPTNRKYHNLKTQERGDYKDMHKFLDKNL